MSSTPGIEFKRFPMVIRIQGQMLQFCDSCFMITITRSPDEYGPMKKLLNNLGRMLRRRLSLRVIVGGRTGLVAWGLSGVGALAVLIWGIKLIAVPLLMIKTASWGMWGFGVVRESQLRKQSLDAVRSGTDKKT